MSPHPTARRAATRLVVLASSLLLVLPLAASQAQTAERKTPGKKFAAYEYGWYPINHVDHFEGKLPRYYDVYGAGGRVAGVGTQNGMITVKSDRRGTTGTVLRRHAHDRGRWEIRLRAKRWESRHTDFRVVAELIPAAKRAQHCGARDIALANYRPTGSKVRFYARNLPDRAFTASRRRMNLSNNYWHTFAVAVRPKRISWFVDGKVRRTERRRAALHGVPLDLRLALEAVPGKKMNRSWLQVDTVRYFSLKSPNDKSIRARRPVRRTHRGAC